MSMAHVKRAYIKPTWTEVQGPWSFFIGFSPFAPLVVVVVPAWTERQAACFFPLCSYASRVGLESRLMKHGSET